MESIQKKTANE